MPKKAKPIRIELALGIMFQHVNCYLMPGDALSLIDCGLYTQENWFLLQEELKQHGYQISDLEQVIITHEHRDHIGMLPEIMANSGAEILAPKAIKAWFEKPIDMNREEVRFNKRLLAKLGFPEEVLSNAHKFFDQREISRPIEEVSRIQYFEEGDRLQLGNTEWEILHTPGHSPTQYIFLEEGAERVFGSDMLLPIAPMPIPVEGKGEDDPESGALASLLKSYERIKAFDIGEVFPGHGPIFSGANGTIDRQLARIQMRKEECYEAIKSGFTTPYQINRKMYPYQETPPDFSGLYMVLGYLQLLQLEGRIRKIEEEKGELSFSSIP
ncbi:MAG: MBL fold metallo-hydrolase [Bacteroidia bacterium]|nr:MBL fold metallo-hydrolase [Bacteroidia bacterium]